MPSQTSTYDRALKLLGFRAQSIAELRRQLLRKGEPAADVEMTIARLRDQKYLDDVDFARQFARQRLLAAGTSRRRIVQELSRRGVSRDVADQALEDVKTDEDV